MFDKRETGDKEEASSSSSSSSSGKATRLGTYNGIILLAQPYARKPSLGREKLIIEN